MISGRRPGDASLSRSTFSGKGIGVGGGMLTPVAQNVLQRVPHPPFLSGKGRLPHCFTPRLFSRRRVPCNHGP